MQIKSHQLAQHLKSKLLPIYLISGDVALLIQDVRASIRAAAKKQQFSTYKVLTVESGFNWQDFYNEVENFSLFLDKTLIEIHHAKAKFDKATEEKLIHYLQNPSPDHCIVLITAKLTAAQQKTKWFQAIQKMGGVIAVWPIRFEELPKWVAARMEQAHLKVKPEAIQLLSDFSEGNLLAVQQAIEKLRLLYSDQIIDLHLMKSAIVDHAAFNIFDLATCALKGEAKQVIRCLQYLKNHAEPALILWALTREIRLHTELQSLLKRAEKIDHIIKGIIAGDVWAALTTLALAMGAS